MHSHLPKPKLRVGATERLLHRKERSQLGRVIGPAPPAPTAWPRRRALGPLRVRSPRRPEQPGSGSAKWGRDGSAVARESVGSARSSVSHVGHLLSVYSPFHSLLLLSFPRPANILTPFIHSFVQTSSRRSWFPLPSLCMCLLHASIQPPLSLARCDPSPELPETKTPFGRLLLSVPPLLPLCIFSPSPQ